MQVLQLLSCFVHVESETLVGGRRDRGGGTEQRMPNSEQVSCRSFFDGVKKVGKQVQGGLPIIGLISRLSSPEGGFDDQVWACLVLPADACCIRILDYKSMCFPCNWHHLCGAKLVVLPLGEIFPLRLTTARW